MLINNAATVYVCKNLGLIIDFYNNSTKVKGSILEDIFFRHGIVKIISAIEDRKKGLIPNL